jgi:hypothetical protein
MYGIVVVVVVIEVLPGAEEMIFDLFDFTTNGQHTR